MDDAGLPMDAETGGSEPDAPQAPAPQPVSGYAPAPREEAELRLDLEVDPFAPAPAFAAPGPDPVPSLDPEPGPTPEAGEPDASAEQPPAEPVSPQEPEEPAVAEQPEDAEGGPAGDLSLEDMVTELRDEEPGEDAGEDDASEEDAEAAGSEPEVEPEEPAGAADASWRDAAAAEAAGTEGPLMARSRLSTRLPFWLYGAAWAVFSGVMTYLLWPVSTEPFVSSIMYAYFIYGGAGMIAIGMVVALTVWLAARAGSSRSERAGLGQAISMRAFGWMAIGVVLWWACLYALDLHRVGVLG